jgi:hypothetical protein
MLKRNNMKYSAYINNEMALDSDNITDCINILLKPLPNEINAWNKYFENNHSHIVNNELVTIIWASKVYQTNNI